MTGSIQDQNLSEPGTPLPLQEHHDDVPTAERSLLSTIPNHTFSIQALSDALYHHKPLQLEHISAVGVPGSAGYRPLLYEMSRQISKSEVEVMAAITTSNMSRDTANKLLGLVTCVSTYH